MLRGLSVAMKRSSCNFFLPHDPKIDRRVFYSFAKEIAFFAFIEICI